MEWLNTKGPLEIKDLRGKFVLLDFWTYCCINCMHILPELKKLEHEFPNELVVIGVHSAKFDTEKEAKNISEAILRYEIEHPVVNDDKLKIWNRYSVSSWPTLYIIDPEGNVVYLQRGEVKADEIKRVLNEAIPYYRENKLLDEKPIKFDLLAYSQTPTPLRFPGKLLADEKSNRLFIADSNHNRIVISSLDGKLEDVIGSGQIGAADGSYESAQFDHPQGMALVGDTLFVADTENHLLRKVDLKQKRVSTVAGTGEQAQNSWPGLADNATIGNLPDRYVGLPKTTAINSPWALLPHGDSLYIAMAGPHQIWKMKLDESEIGPYAGNGREDIVDGKLLPKIPYEMGYSSFAQPSGLTTDGEQIFVADSEGSSIRAVPFDPTKRVRTVIGTSRFDYGRLFTFGDVDGPARTAKLQHPLGVCYVDGTIYVADTYNNKIKAVDATSGEVKTVAGTGEPGNSDEPTQFDEPAGLSYAGGKLYIADTNNHLIRVLDLVTKKVSTLTIDGLAPLPVKERPDAP
ncbi:redoxin domain-containing protein [bacterium]|nr:redoxin domain-containing protein [bacterium]